MKLECFTVLLGTQLTFAWKEQFKMLQWSLRRQATNCATTSRYQDKGELNADAQQKELWSSRLMAAVAQMVGNGAIIRGEVL